MSEELLPCPFCGSEAQMIEGTGAFGGRVQIDCTNCRNATWWWDKSVAVKSWNRRATPAALTNDVLMRAISDTAARGHTWASRALSEYRAALQSHSEGEAR